MQVKCHHDRTLQPKIKGAVLKDQFHFPVNVACPLRDMKHRQFSVAASIFPDEQILLLGVSPLLNSTATQKAGQEQVDNRKCKMSIIANDQ